MTEYIDREATLKLLETHGLSNGASLGRHSGECDIATEIISKIPAADVAPVKRGKWEQQELAPSELRFCSCCGYKRGKHKLNFCPNCGADMRGETK